MPRLQEFLEQQYGLLDDGYYEGSNLANYPQFFLPQAEQRARMTRATPERLDAMQLARDPNEVVAGFYDSDTNQGYYASEYGPVTLPHELNHMSNDLALERDAYNIPVFLAKLFGAKGRRQLSEKDFDKYKDKLPKNVGHSDLASEAMSDMMGLQGILPRGQTLMDQPRFQEYFAQPGATEHFLRNENRLMPKVGPTQDQGILGGLLNEYLNLTRDYPIR